jgi:hypothetical protein
MDPTDAMTIAHRPITGYSGHWLFTPPQDGDQVCKEIFSWTRPLELSGLASWAARSPATLSNVDGG